MTSRSDDEVFAELYARLGRPFEVFSTLSALVGEPPAAVAQGVGLALATSVEARELIDTMHPTVRSLATSLQAHNQRCIGELRGPVLWSETMSARASSFGDRDLFICATPARAYDIDENRILVAALRLVRRAAKDATDHAHGFLDDPVLRHARTVGTAASRWLDHPSLANIAHVRPGPRALRRTRSGKHKATYRPALQVLDRAVEPVAIADLARWCRPAVRARHRVLLGLLERLEADGRRSVPEFRAERGALLAGPLQFFAGRRDGSGLGGVFLGSLLIDTPGGPLIDRTAAEAELAARADGRPSFLVVDDDDLDRALLRAVEVVGASIAAR
ncbi:MAG TPA: hypothetical protein VIY72_08995 [Acidimicrobiales bacterium]